MSDIVELQELIEQLRKGTAGLTLYEIEALWGEAATALSSMDAKPSVAAQNDVLYQLSRITENDIPLDMWEIRSIVKAAMQEMARLRRLERSTEALKSWEAEKRKTTGDRFFIDHGQIHDRATGKHVTTDEDSVFCDGINSALELLNTLNAAATEAADAITTLRDENEAMRALVPFAKFGDAVMDAWPEGSIDGFELQDMLKEFGLIAPVEGGFRDSVHIDAHNCSPVEGDEWLMPTQAAIEARAALSDPRALEEQQ